MVEEVRVTYPRKWSRKENLSKLLSLPNLDILGFPGLAHTHRHAIGVCTCTYAQIYIQTCPLKHALSDYKQNLRFFPFGSCEMKEGRGHRVELKPGHWARMMGPSRLWPPGPREPGYRGTAHKASWIQVRPRKLECLGRVRDVMIKHDLMSNKWGICQVKPM